MSRPTPWNGTSALLVAGLLFPDSRALADRLVLEGGGVIETANWWVEGEILHYDAGQGTIGLPRAMVVRIERDEGTRAPEDAPTAGEPPAPPAATLRVTADQAERMRQARTALEAREFERAAALYEVLLEEFGPHPAFLTVGYALCQMALGRDAPALGAVLDGLVQAPDDPELHELLGDLRDREERVEEALAAWRRAFDLAPGDRLRGKILKAERELHAGGDYDLLRSSHFNLRFDGKVDGHVVDALLDELETLYGDLARDLEHAPSQPITVLLYPERDFRDVTQAAESVAGLYDGKIRVPLGGLRRVEPPVRALLAHELTHAVVHSKTRGQCPRWLHEGLAQRFEGRTLARSDRNAMRHRLQQGDPALWESEGFSYPLALSLTSWLEDERGFTTLVDLLHRLGAGESLDGALRSLYGTDYAGLCRRWAGAVLSEVEP